MLQYLLYFAICLTATTLGAISGIGGGVFIKPILDAISTLGVSTISFLSGCTVLSMSIVSMLRGRGGDAKLDPKNGTLLAMGGALGGVGGKWVFDFIKTTFQNTSLISTLQSACMVLLTVGVMIYTCKKEKISTKTVKHPVACTAIGLGLGVISSFLGIGGGPINLAVLHYFFSMNTKTAALHSLYIILFSQIASLCTTLFSGNIPAFDGLLLALMALGGILGGFLGRSFSKKMSPSMVDTLFRWMLVLITAISCYNLCHYAGQL